MQNKIINVLTGTENNINIICLLTYLLTNLETPWQATARNVTCTLQIKNDT